MYPTFSPGETYREFDYDAPITAWWLPLHDYSVDWPDEWRKTPRPAPAMVFHHVGGCPRLSDLAHFTQLPFPA